MIRVDDDRRAGATTHPKSRRQSPDTGMTLGERQHVRSRYGLRRVGGGITRASRPGGSARRDTMSASFAHGGLGLRRITLCPEMYAAA